MSMSKRASLVSAVVAAGLLALPASAEEPAPPAPGATTPAGPAPVSVVQPEAAAPAVHITLPAWMPSMEVQPGLDVIAGYSLRVTPVETGSAEWFHAFYLERALPSLTVRVGPAEAKLAVESVYSTTEGALAGVAGDSLLVRVREARAGYRPTSWLAFDLGVVPTLVIPTFDRAFGLRALGPVFVEEAGFASPADLGVTAKVSFPKGYGFAAAGVFNGEGYTNRELNRGKNIEVAALVHPVPRGFLSPLSVFGAYTNGSSGTGLSRADRVTAALLWQGDRVRGGVTFTYALGVRDDGGREAYVVDAYLRGEPIPRFILAARGAVFDRDVRATQDLAVSVTGAVGFRIAPPLEAFLTLQRSAPEAAASSATPGSDFWEGRLLARFFF